MKEDEEVISVLIGLLSNTNDMDMRIAAADSLGYTGLSSVRTVLMQVIDDKRERVELRLAAVRALGRTVPPSK